MSVLKRVGLAILILCTACGLATAWRTHQFARLVPPATPYSRILLDLHDAAQDLASADGTHATEEPDSVRFYRASTRLDDALLATELLQVSLNYSHPMSVSPLTNRIHHITLSAHELVLDRLNGKPIERSRLSTITSSIAQLLGNLPPVEDARWRERLNVLLTTSPL